MLQLEAVEGGYGKKKVLHGVSMSVGEGEVVSMLGRNGMGKTTTLRTIMGLAAPTAGRILFDGQDISGWPPERVSRLGIGYVPEGRGIFPTLSVIENLTMAACPGAWTLARVLELFPRLGQRLGHGGGQLSGGEQQMLSIGRALMLNPRLILLDEATEGLAPLVQEEIWRCLAAIRRDKISVLFVDKDLEALLELSDRLYVLEKGEVRWSGSSADVAADRGRIEQLVGLEEEDGKSKLVEDAVVSAGTGGPMRDHEVRIDRRVSPARLEFAAIFNTSVTFVDRHIAEGRAEKVMARWRDRTMTYAALADGVQRTAAALRVLGIGPGDRVMLFVKDTQAFYLAFLGAVRIGAVAIPVNTFLRSADYAYMLADSNAKAVFASEGTFAEVEPALAAEGVHALHRIACDGSREGWTELSAMLAEAGTGDGSPHPTRPGDPCFWLYSSGSTGSPKASVHEHKDMLLTAEHFGVGTLGIIADDLIFSAPKLFFAYGLGNALSFPLHIGATQILLEDRPTAESTLDMITQFRPTVYWGVPTLYAAQLATLDRGHTADFTALRMCLSGGEPLPPSVLEGWQRRAGMPILDGIGSSEVLHIYCSNRHDRLKPGSCGLPVPGYELRVVDAKGHDVPAGEVGELWVRGDSVTRLYWNKPEKTASSMREGGWFRSGDTVYQDADGFFHFCGRDDDMLKVGGIWVAPFEVESALASHPAVLEAAVIGAADDSGLVKPKAFVVLRNPSTAGPQVEMALREFVKSRLAPFKYPRWIEFLDELPKTASGKIQRFRLR